MANPFDDLIPAATASENNPFADITPQTPEASNVVPNQQVADAASGGGWTPPAPDIGRTPFDDLVPQDTSPRLQQTQKDIEGKAAEETSLNTLKGDTVRSAHSVKRGFRTNMFMLGLDDDIDGLANTLAESSAIEAMYPKSKERAELDAQLAKRKRENPDAGWLETAKNLAVDLSHQPKGTASLVAENIASMSGPLVGGVAGGAAGSAIPVVGTALGAAAGAGAGSGFVDYGASFEEYIRGKRPGLVTAEDWKRALSDKNLVNEAHWYAAKHSTAVAVADLVGMKLGGSVAARAFTPGSSLGKRGAGIAAGTAIDAAAETGGEAFGQLWGKGEVDIQDALLEGALGLITSGATVAVEPAIRTFERRKNDAAEVPLPTGPLPGTQETFSAQPRGEEVQEPVSSRSDVPVAEAAARVRPEISSVDPVAEAESRLVAKEEEGVISRPIEVTDTPRRVNLEDPFDDRLQGELSFDRDGEHINDIAYQEFENDRGGKVLTVSIPNARERLEETPEIADRLVKWAARNGYQEIAIPDTELMYFHEAVEAANKALGGEPAQWTSPPMGPNGDALGASHSIHRVGAQAGKVFEMENTGYIPGGITIVAPERALDATGARTKAAHDLLLGVHQVAKAFGLGPKFRTAIIRNDPSLGWKALASRLPGGKYRLSINLGSISSASNMYGILMHEMGHLIMWEHFSKAPVQTQIAIKAAYMHFVRTKATNSSKYGDMLLARDSFTNLQDLLDERNMKGTDYELSAMAPEERHYWAGFEEWFAEQTARWATTNMRPVSIVQKYFKSLGRHLLRAYERMGEKFGLTFTPSSAMNGFLNSLYDEGVRRDNISKNIMDALEAETQRINQKALDQEPGNQVTAAPYQEETNATRYALGRLFKGNVPPAVQNMAAQADKFNAIYKYGLTLVQVAKRNLHIEELQKYVETMRAMHLEEHKVQEAALRVSKAWKALKPRDQAGRVGALIDDVVKMVYRTPQEVAQDVSRLPTQAELQLLIQKHKVNPEGVKVYAMVTQMFQDFLTLNENNLIMEAQKISNPAELQRRLISIRDRFLAMRRKPYFPALRFGEHSLTVRDKNGKVIYFETVEGSSINPLKSARRNQLKRRDEIAKDLGILKDEVKMGVIPKDARPLMGMPQPMLELMGEKLALSQSQKELLEQLKFDLSPAQSFKHRFQRKRNIDGYSVDFQRAFAHYFFHGAKFFSKVKYADQLRGYIKTIGDQSKFMPDGVKRMEIRNFLDDHYNNVMDPKPDWAALRGAVFLWALGFSPAAATLNLMQLPLGTYPFLASKFGDLRAMKAISRAGTQLSTFYKRGKYEGATDFQLRAISEGIKQGTITEAMAPELAATAEGRNLGLGFGGNATQKTWQKFQEYSSTMFELAEQTNRRITFRAGLTLGWENHTSSHVDQIVKENQLEYNRLTGPTGKGGNGWSDREARAYLTAQDAVNTTQFEYARWARPRMFRGKLATLFVFKTFTQNTLFFLWNYPGPALRFTLIMAFLGGLMGMPGAEDLSEIVKAIAFQLFGKDFDVEQEARQLVLDLSNDTIPPDLMLHGMSRRGFGIPTILDMMGNTVGRGDFTDSLNRLVTGKSGEAGAAVPFPMLDRSRAAGQGRILPIEVGKLFGPTNNQSRIIADQTQNAAGAAFGVGFNIYKALTDSQLSWSDAKRWEKAVPRQMGSLSRSYRAFSEGRERNRSGSTIVNYDVSDTEQMMEALALAFGYNNLRQSAQWDRIMAEREAITFWQLRKTGILKQYFEALDTPKELERVKGAVKKYNDDLPKEAKDMAISADTIRRSMAARERSRTAQESGQAVAKTQRGLQKSIQRLYPEATVDVRRVK